MHECAPFCTCINRGDLCPKCQNPYLLDTLHCRRCGTQRVQMPAQPQSFLTADAGPSCCPMRHAQGGEMLDRDGVPCPWNNRWSAGIHILNDSWYLLASRFDPQIVDFVQLTGSLP